MLPIRTVLDPVSPRTAAVKPAAMNGATAITANMMTRMADCRNANVRPRVWSSTSLPTIVYPVTYATPAHAPSRTTRIVTTTRFGISAISASGKAANVIDRPNRRRRENPRRMRRPRNMPRARPTKIAAKTTPQPAWPPCRVSLM